MKMNKTARKAREAAAAARGLKNAKEKMKMALYLDLLLLEMEEKADGK